MRFLVKLHFVLRTIFGLDPRVFLRSLTGLPKYFKDYLRFSAMCRGRLTILPCLQDWAEEAGAVDNEYFWQDLLVAKLVYAAKPVKHVDVGSRLDGFVAHVASYRDIEVMDIRPLSRDIPGVRYVRADVMSLPKELVNYCDSLSCLHALEHFGLGRYGDPIDPEGHIKGIAGMSAMLSPGGNFYLSVPIGAARVEFNANRIFDPREIIEICEDHALQLSSVTVLHDKTLSEITASEMANLNAYSGAQYALAVFLFQKE